MASHHSPPPTVRLLLVLLLLATSAMLVGVGGFLQALAPAADQVEPERRRPASRATTLRTATRAPPDTTEDSIGPFQVSGVVLDASGEPAPGIQVAWTAPTVDGYVWLVVTDANGRFNSEVPGGVYLNAGDDTQPARVQITEDRDDLTFVRMEHCPVEVTVLDPAGHPVERQPVRYSASVDGFAHEREWGAKTDAQGTVYFPDMPCGVARIWSVQWHHPPAVRPQVDTLVEQRVVLQQVHGVRIFGQVTDPDGQPIESARVRAGDASQRTNQAGSYELLVDPANLSTVRASAWRYESQTERLRIALSDTAAADLSLNFVLSPARQVRVYCAGLPDDSCATVAPLMCTRPFLPMGSDCSGTPTTCRCPEGWGAIRGGGLAVEVEPHDTEVWLDMRGRGGLSGTVRVNGRPPDDTVHRCDVVATRIPEALEDLPGGMTAGAQVTCLPDGEWALEGLEAGHYLVRVDATPGRGSVPRVTVDDSTTDVGTIDIGGGGRIEGVVLDGATGEGVAGVTVVAFAGAPPTSTDSDKPPATPKAASPSLASQMATTRSSWPPAPSTASPSPSKTAAPSPWSSRPAKPACSPAMASSSRPTTPASWWCSRSTPRERHPTTASRRVMSSSACRWAAWTSAR